jgi:hypothetical protein
MAAHFSDAARLIQDDAIVLQNESFVTGSFARLERAEQVIPDRGADAEVHDLSMVMEMMELLESPPIGDVRKVGTAMVLPVVQEGEMVVAGIQPEDQQRGDAGW